jgi:hypothetical protein
MTVDDLRRALELLPPTTLIALPRDELLAAVRPDPATTSPRRSNKSDC